MVNTETKGKKIRIQQYRSSIGFNRQQRAVLRGLGFRRLNQVLEREATPEIIGMINKIPHLVRIIGE